MKNDRIVLVFARIRQEINGRKLYTKYIKTTRNLVGGKIHDFSKSSIHEV